MKKISKILAIMLTILNLFTLSINVFGINAFAASNEVDQYTRSILHFEGTDGGANFIDETGKAWTGTGNAKISTEQKRNGNSSLYLDGSSYISTPKSADFNISGDFTIEMWVYETNRPSNTASQVLMKSSGTDWRIDMKNTGTEMTFYCGNTYYGNSTFEVNKWQHIAVVRSGSTLSIYKDGVKIGSPTGSSGIVSSTSDIVIGGGFNTNFTNFTGYIDDVKVYNVAKYIDNFNPNAPINLQANPGEITKTVNLTWDAVNGATGYNVKRSLTSGGPYTNIADYSTVTTNAYTDQDSTLEYGKTYFYVVSAEINGVESLNSNEASITLTESVTPPPTGNSAILELTMTNGEQKEYDMTAAEISDFLTWYDARSGGAAKAYYIINKKVNIKPFLNRKEYIAFDKISSFEVKEYSDN